MIQCRSILETRPSTYAERASHPVDRVRLRAPAAGGECRQQPAELLSCLGCLVPLQTAAAAPKLWVLRIGGSTCPTLVLDHLGMWMDSGAGVAHGISDMHQPWSSGRDIDCNGYPHISIMTTPPSRAAIVAAAIDGMGFRCIYIAHRVESSRRGIVRKHGLRSHLGGSRYWYAWLA